MQKTVRRSWQNSMQRLRNIISELAKRNDIFNDSKQWNTNYWSNNDVM